MTRKNAPVSPQVDPAGAEPPELAPEAPRQDAEGVWRDGDEPRPAAPHRDPDCSGNTYDADEPLGVDEDEDTDDDEQRG